MRFTFSCILIMGLVSIDLREKGCSEYHMQDISAKKQTEMLLDISIFVEKLCLFSPMHLAGFPEHSLVSCIDNDP